jgi:uncharacterized heparinase superfamily protein
MTLKNRKNMQTHPLWQKMLQKVRAHVYRSPIYLMTLKQKKLGSVSSWPDFLNHGDQNAAINILNGKFPFAGRLYQTNAEPWTIAQDDHAWQSFVHGFGWLDDLLFQNDEQGVVKARYLISSWIDLHGVWTPLAWRADVMAQRLVFWARHAQKLIRSADDTFGVSFKNSLSLQASLLSRSYFKDLSGEALLRALQGQVYIALYLEGFEKGFQRAFDRLLLELDHQILPDGGHISRCPMVLVDVLKLCLEVVRVLEDKKIEIPQKLRGAIDRMAPMVRTMRHGDGALGLFHGGQEGNALDIEQLLTASNNHGKALSDARHSGYQRIEAGRTVLLMDVAAPPDVHIHKHGHAAPLSLEMSTGEERILVNCGAVIGGDPNWQEALAATAAHNTLTVDEKNCIQLLEGGGIAPKAVSVTYKRFEENGQTLIDASHDAYKEALGLLHNRSIYINKTGDDLRVEDSLIGSGGSSYAISLHLHPDVDASLVQDGKAALLKLKSGVGWLLKVNGVALKLKESIYIGATGQMRHTDQIIMHGPLRGDGASIKWRLSRIGSV